jgi:hypothetical protein
MAKKRDVAEVCPICLRAAVLCRVCSWVASRKFCDSLGEGVTKSRALSLCHPVVCHTCRRQVSLSSPEQHGPGKCHTCRTSLQVFFPSWFRWDDLMPSDKEYVHHADGIVS